MKTKGIYSIKEQFSQEISQSDINSVFTPKVQTNANTPQDTP